LSQSRAANIKGRHAGHSADLKALDLLAALLFHLLIFTVIGLLIYWQQRHQPEPLKRIEVMMISAKQLAKLEHPSHRKAKAVKHKRVKVKAKPKARPKPKPKPKKAAAKPKPALTVHKAGPQKPKPVAKAAPKKHAPAAVKKKKVEDNFDPFAPLASTTDRTKSSKKASTSHPDLANLVGKQLSSSEKERYIALMQAAVQQHWKLPISAAKFTDPLVEMQLLPTGAVASVKILESSGNAAMDASLIRAIKAAAPFELPRQQFEFFRVNRIRFHPLK